MDEKEGQRRIAFGISIKGAFLEAVHSLSEKVSNGHTIDPIVGSAETFPEEANFSSPRAPISVI